MLYWKAPNEQAKPQWLDGCPNAQCCGVFWWVGSPLYHAPFERLEWLETSDGWAVASHGELDASEYLRERRWAVTMIVEDARGVDWTVPAILAPDGVPAVAQVRRRVNGQYVREFVSAAQEAAVDAALAVRSNTPLTLEEQTDACLAILETTYHIDGDTFAVLGLIDDVLAVHCLKMAAAVLEDAD